MTDRFEKHLSGFFIDFGQIEYLFTRYAQKQNSGHIDEALQNVYRSIRDLYKKHDELLDMIEGFLSLANKELTINMPSAKELPPGIFSLEITEEDITQKDVLDAYGYFKVAYEQEIRYILKFMQTIKGQMAYLARLDKDILSIDEFYMHHFLSKLDRHLMSYKTSINQVYDDMGNFINAILKKRYYFKDIMVIIVCLIIIVCLWYY